MVRSSAIGDIIHCLPVLMAVRRAWPTARISWVVEEVWAPILEGHREIDRLIRVRTKAWRKKNNWFSVPREVRRARREMRDFGADVTLDLMGNFKGAMLARWSGARRVIGASAATRAEAASAGLLGETWPATGMHAADRALSLLEALGLEPAALAKADFGGPLLLPNPPHSAVELLQEIDLVGRPLVVIQPGAGWANKLYPAELWGRVAQDLDADGFQVVLPLAPGDEELCHRAAAASGGKARPVSAVAFATLAALHRRARLVLGSDSGPVHIAHALGTPVLCLIGPTDPLRNGPYRAQEQVIFHQLPCSYCYKRYDGPRACMLAITPREIVDRARQLLAEDRATP